MIKWYKGRKNQLKGRSLAMSAVHRQRIKDNKT